MFNISIDFFSFKTQIDVDFSDTIQQVKHKIQEKHDINVDKQYLFLGDRRLENQRTLNYYDIKENDQIRLVRINPGKNIEIYIKFDYKSTRLQVQSSYTIGEVKEKYREMTGVPVIEQRYIYNGKELDNRRYLSEYLIVGSETLQLVYRLKGGTLSI